MKKLPIGIQTFEKLITEGYLYIDKTKYIYQLISQGSVYFLSRPRRFGKSLLISTLDAIFHGKKELFQGLYIYDQPWEWKDYPVIRIDFSKKHIEQPDDLKNYICERLQEIAETYQIELKLTDYDSQFK